MTNLTNILSKLTALIEKNKAYLVDGSLNRNLLAADARKYDLELLNLLQKDKELKEHFFAATDGGLVFKKDVFLQFIMNKEFLPDSYTKYKIKIGLGAEDGSLLSESGDVVLNWPYKDAILEGGQDKEDQKRSEVFFNEVLAPDQITRLLDDKVFTNWKRYDKDGEHDLDALKDDDNLIIKGNNLVVLHSLNKRYAGKVKLIYIDPPYNTGGDSFGYNDRFNHSSWLTFMKNRLEIAKHFLLPDGVIFVQCDDNEQAYLQVLLDEVFGVNNKINTIVVKMSEATGMKMSHVSQRLPKLKEYILAYKNSTVILNSDRIKIPAGEIGINYNKLVCGLNDNEINTIKQLMEQDTVTDEDIIKGDKILEKMKIVPIQSEFANWNSMSPDEQQKIKQMQAHRLVRDVASSSAKKLTDKKKLQVSQHYFLLKTSRSKAYLIKADYSDSAKDPNIKLIFADAYLFVNPGDLWSDIKTTRVDREGSVALLNGKKPEKLLQRIIDLVTNPGDLVLDYHLGSGTTAAVAHKMGRQYIGIEQLYYGDNDPCVRLHNVIKGDQTGVSKSVDWQDGGSFVYANIMNNSNKFRKRVEAAKNDDDYIQLLAEATSSSFLSYRVDPKKLNQDEFRKLSAAEKRRLLLELIDNNTLYVNYEDINDPIFKVSEKDKEFNKKLYEKN